MKFLLQFILIGVLAWILGLFLPWWSVVIAAFLVSLLLSEAPAKNRSYSSLRRKKRKAPSLSFLAGFLAVFLLWGITVLVIDNGNDSVLSSKISEIISSGSKDSPSFIILLTALVGGLLGGLSAMTGGLLGRNLRA